MDAIFRLNYSTYVRDADRFILFPSTSGQEVFYPFLSLPDKTVYKEYYEIIMHPISLRAILKLVRGTDRRKSSTKTNPFRTWQAFEDEVSYLWRNAREFNEDDSEIVAISHKLEVTFYDRIYRGNLQLTFSLGSFPPTSCRSKEIRIRPSPNKQ